MKIKYAKTIVPVGILMAGSCAWMSVGLTENSKAYSPRTESQQQNFWQGAEEYYRSTHINHLSGKVENADFVNAWQEAQPYINDANRAIGLTWTEEGPDNVGGRTRAILVDRNNHNIVYAGGVNGGLFKSLDGGGWWSRVYSFDYLNNPTTPAGSSLPISSICQDKNGRIYVATGCSFEGSMSRGYGIFYSDDNAVTWSSLSTTPSLVALNINVIAADPIQNDKIWIGVNRLYSYTPTGGLVTATPTTVAGTIYDFKISDDGNVMVLCAGGSNTWVSTDAGATWANKTGTGATQVAGSNQRIEYGISFEKNSTGNYSLFASCSKASGLWEGYISNDNGTTWSKTVPAGVSLNPVGSQGGYNNICSGIPGYPDRFTFGGIDNYQWIANSTNPSTGQVYQKSFWFLSSPNPIYVHADNHEMTWDHTTKQLYIGNDGGVFKSLDNNLNFFYSSNRGYNVTQFYGIGYSGRDQVIGGTQDNGTQYNDKSHSFYQSFVEVLGGDGFDCDISQIDPSVLFGSLYYGSFLRSNNGGETMASMISGELTKYGTPGDPGAGNFGFFNTVGRLYENENDANSTDTLDVMNNTGDTINIGDVVYIKYNHRSYNLLDSVLVTATSTILPGELVTRVVDKVQSLFALGLRGGTTTSPSATSVEQGVWITRNACDFSANPIWDSIPGLGALMGNNQAATAIEFSTDGNHMYVGCSNGRLIRVSGLNTYYGGTGNYDVSGLTAVTIDTYTGAIGGIGIDHNNPNHLVVTITGFGSANVQEVLNATTATSGGASGGDISGILPSMPVFDAVVDVSDATGNTILVGTEFGIWGTNNGGTSWTYESGSSIGSTDGPGPVAVYALRQQNRPWGTYTKNPGVIYAGTHGRGIWKSETFISIGNDLDNPSNKPSSILNLTVYPNPATELATLEFTLSKDADDLLIQVFNLSGKLTYTQNIGKATKGKNNQTLDLTTYAKGTYMVTISAGKQRFTNKLVVR